MVRFDSFDADSQFKTTVNAVTPTGKVPVLVDGGLVVWDTLAIAEYVAEQFPDKQALAGRQRGTRPRTQRVRRDARGLYRLAQPLPDEHRSQSARHRRADLARPSRRARRCGPPRGDVERPAGRTRRPDAVWRLLAWPTPTSPRCACACSTYALPVPPEIAAYVERVCALPGVKAWIDEALAEQDFLDFEEPYRLRTAEAPWLSFSKLPTMEIYMVGGAVRDALLGLPVKDRDWVVVGATPEALVAQGFLPVGRDFPVFLHPHTKEEYALARTERKTAPGYHGFAIHAAPEVTLEEDLARRDLTINSIAIHADLTDQEGTFDPQQRASWSTPMAGSATWPPRCCATSRSAFREDPVRILRVARLAARFTDFSVAPGNHGLDARHGARRRGGPPGGRARLARAGPGLMEAAALAHVRGAARLRRPGAPAARGGPPVGRAPTRGVPPGGRHRRAPDDGDGHERAA